MPNKELLALFKNISAVKTGEFTLSSGKKSNLYIDCRRVTLHPEGARLIGKIVLEKIRGLNVQAIGGLTLGADPITSAVVTLGDIPGFIVRKKEKEHGTKQKIEGHLQPGWKVVVVEDVSTSGASALQAIAAVEAAGASVVKVISVVDREEGAAEALKAYTFDPLLKKSDFF
ncbi:orotate phosphoribosyltransferase [candidate division WOR-1 bacterium RIFOXYA12_FULL_52_29]|uniref:Orotate phosphoribosyltransferase n=1 Tax=candidate division WOR-1 bacterium RIFOXYC12_FULL_54_18 TaxID=1802584 RepID=A0A1F4T6S4_UNCSA|nr:MAG: orotate phosphoribosyltransferase [candidate division WOR-1 bacterium RIFOXYA2_FULL_51_19]OGC18025.1 MAG: orotate phosphoribosyltransferase [candidate division WOR-1 bacterium RIFOXYA12_FULL_52_29]OGC26881.1 MAG: orotate phosphoribosyltransferase [candidate division WOR-1 bacterium RIFOXYB2_FULL_45_9]OGC28442.1 MAG: orotate phosphoribosyltransferase [candidate division WOR-1 bacterium RIFOXYC12_FULL_54_18]OGC31103.1 MAG: orotate phosphoribosyltransferase [candidate division WOR-1 bacter